MANGKIVYTAALFKSIYLPGANYLSLADTPAFDAGTGDFNISFLFYVHPGISTANYYKLLVGKGVMELQDFAGWHISYNPNTDKIKVVMNDGSASPLSFGTTLSVSKGVWYWLHLNVDRDGDATLRLYQMMTGAAASETMAIASNPYSMSNSEPFYLGNWGATANRYFQGYIGYLRVDMGRAVPAAWIAKEFDLVRWGAPRKHPADLTETWLFGESLIGESDAAYTMTYYGAGSAYYEPTLPYGLTTYQFGKNYNYQTEPGYLETNIVERAIDGTARSYRLPVDKKFRNPVYHNVPHSQVAAFWGLWNSRAAFNYHDDGDAPADFRGVLMRPPRITLSPYFDGDAHLYDVELEIQET